MNKNFKSKKFRDTWVAVHVKRGIATQLRALRGDLTQALFGKKIGKPQTVVSRLEDPNYGSMRIDTLLHIAARLNIALLVKFVPFSKLEKETMNITEEDLKPISYDEEQSLSIRSPLARLCDPW